MTDLSPEVKEALEWSDKFCEVGSAPRFLAETLRSALAREESLERELAEAKKERDKLADDFNFEHDKRKDLQSQLAAKEAALLEIRQIVKQIVEDYRLIEEDGIHMREGTEIGADGKGMLINLYESLRPFQAAQKENK